MKQGYSIPFNDLFSSSQEDKVSLSNRYFYTEDAGGETYENVDLFVNEILMALATSGAGVLRLNEGTLIDIASGKSQYTNAITNLLSSNFDTSNVTRPHAYLVWMLYDNNMNLIPAGSGVKQVENPNELGILLKDQIPIIENGYLHAGACPELVEWVSNGSNKEVNFDNFKVTYLRGQTRQINHYYPYGLSISGLGGNYDEYLNKYTSKELQTGEFDPHISSGLEMFDFGARFYDPQLGRWFVPDPAEQFANPYLAMGNNPVRFTDPNGEWIVTAAIIVIGAISGGMRAHKQGTDVVSGVVRGLLIGGVSAMLAPIGGGGMPFIADLGIAVAQGTAIGAMNGYLWNEEIGKSALIGGVSAAAMFTLTSPNLKNWVKGKKFRTNHNVFKDFSSGNYTKSGGVWQQDALDYFGYEGKYLKNFDNYFSKEDFAKTVNDMNTDLPANSKLGDIYYSERVFKDKNYDWLKLVHSHEMVHRMEVLQGKIPNGFKEILAGEYRAYYQNINNLGHYPNFSIKSFNKQSLIDQIDFNGGLSGLYNPKQYFYFKRMTENVIPLRW